MASNDVTILGVGDLVLHRPDIKQKAEELQPVFRQADIRYGQLEMVVSNRGEVHNGLALMWRFPPEDIMGFKYLGIDCASAQGNHAMEWGPTALLDTLEAAEKVGVRAFGAGKNLDEARKPVILERKGTRVAFLGYGSAIAFGDEADTILPGVNPMRITTLYEMIEHNQPGTRPRVHTIPNPEDMANMVEDIKKAKQVADVVAIAWHAGVHYTTRGEMAQYQYTVGHAAIDAGADVIFATHAHMLKAIEVYKGKVIFHGLGNFIAGPTNPPKGVNIFGSAIGRNLREATASLQGKPDPRWPEYKRDAAYLPTGIAKVVVSNKKVQRVSFIPMFENPMDQAWPVKVDPGSDKLIARVKSGDLFNEVVDFQMAATSEAGLKTQFKLEGDELVIVT